MVLWRAYFSISLSFGLEKIQNRMYTEDYVGDGQKWIKYMSYAVLETSYTDIRKWQNRFECGPNLNSFPFVISIS